MLIKLAKYETGAITLVVMQSKVCKSGYNLSSHSHGDRPTGKVKRGAITFVVRSRKQINRAKSHTGGITFVVIQTDQKSKVRNRGL